MVRKLENKTRQKDKKQRRVSEVARVLQKGVKSASQVSKMTFWSGWLGKEKWWQEKEKWWQEKEVLYGEVISHFLQYGSRCSFTIWVKMLLFLPLLLYLPFNQSLKGKDILKLRVIGLTRNPSIWKAEAGELPQLLRLEHTSKDRSRTESKHVFCYSALSDNQGQGQGRLCCSIYVLNLNF